eukprot:CAMPEP_0170276814 /NCGR_PEP_ID=MMETSP0116_2-20130129/38393_1 /TAXON_ID=400756 /ORGANISM="Durinskia baltica, Strain CSIRO CS-38" /LENGTH=341 /DNA_ID=CAMNT_0010528089 /DNA_START=26 /DNA_END=1048 /DNA_ORIENTATION=+
MGASQSIPEAGPVPGMEWCGSSELKPGALLREDRDVSRRSRSSASDPVIRFDRQLTPTVRSHASLNGARPATSCCAPLDLKAGTAAMKQLFSSGNDRVTGAQFEHSRRMKASTAAKSSASASASGAAKPAASSSAKASARRAPASARTPQKAAARPTPTEEGAMLEKFARAPAEGAVSHRAVGQPLALRPMVAQRPRLSTPSASTGSGSSVKVRASAPPPTTSPASSSNPVGMVASSASSAAASSVPKLRMPPLRLGFGPHIEDASTERARAVTPGVPPPVTLAFSTAPVSIAMAANAVACPGAAFAPTPRSLSAAAFSARAAGIAPVAALAAPATVAAAG